MKVLFFSLQVQLRIKTTKRNHVICCVISEFVESYLNCKEEEEELKISVYDFFSAKCYK